MTYVDREPWPLGRPPQLGLGLGRRRLSCYARHSGHADIIRESIDGLVGEVRPD